MMHDDLFSDESHGFHSVIDHNGEMLCTPLWLSAPDALLIFKRLLHDVPWQKESISMYGRTVEVPRRIAWYGDPEAMYRYSGVVHQPLPWTKELEGLKQRVEKVVGASFNSVLCNLYRDGHDSMGWHRDNEKELGRQPTIASLSLGATRYFDCRLKTNPAIKHRIALQSGSLVVMKGDFQQYWEHQVPKQTKITEPRINLTFRFVHPINNDEVLYREEN